ncbi:MAG: DUF3047 domain-containing protein [Hyphomicrobiales bacterium]|nr:DUF3047 domain-containing protein [Hyphomicrobiales bacterium]
MTACGPAPEPPDNRARFKVLGAVDSYDREGWRVAGPQAAVDARTAALPFQGVPALRLRRGAGPVAFVRVTHSKLWVTPFLSWSWFLTYPATVRPPARVVVGFAGGRRDGGRALREVDGLALPDHDRRLELVWADSALRRGSLGPAAAGAADRAYAVRGGRENAGTWWLETVDLATLYQRAWPGDDASRASIAFYGVLAAAAQTGAPPDSGPSDAAAYLSGIALSR